jgi:glycosyltransferase A (GT-A) superfamily protein (DUF2064 family)
LFIFYVSLTTKKKIKLNSPRTTAILVFANSAIKELECKAIANGEELFDTLTQTTLEKVKRTGLPFFHITEKEQVGGNFGERFTNAIATVFAQGFETIITIGNDTPHLNSQHLKKAAYQLSVGKTVIGPSADGGFYLLGLQKRDFDPTSFKNLPWQRLNLFNCISQLFNSASITTVILPVLQDLDTEHDLKSILRFSRSLNTFLRDILIRLIGYVHMLLYPRDLVFDQHLSNCPYNKGSPRVLSA